MKKLPYRAQTGMGHTFDIAFPLHDETRDAVRVGQLVSTVLQAIDNDIGVAGETSNGDVLKAVAMAMAIRAGMIQSPHETVERLSADLLRTALDAVAEADRQSPQIGHA